MTRRSLPVAALFLALAATGCTAVIESHHRPGEPKISFEKTVVIVSVPEVEDSERARRIAENELVSRLPGLNASPSFRLIAAKDLVSGAQLKSWSSAEGFDGFVLVWVDRIVERNESSVDDSSPSRDLVTFCLKASVVSVREDREVWTGVVQLRNPYPLTKRLTAVARALARTLRAEGLTD